MDERDEAREALEQIAATRRTTAHRVASPKGYYALAGAGVGLVILGLGLDGWARWVLYGTGLLIVFGAMQWYTRHTGAVAWATLREPGAWRAWLMAGISFVSMGVAFFGPLPATVAAVVTAASWAVLGPAWDADWVRSIEKQP
ncbi:hypothetical protein [Aeromicrobium duanguangcaii]|uniref:TIGR02611 family protein n=1 Tax=Aeromicrobium duanguangcaii TaxID=2968086 RepID=A0ABY5KBM5_9ACTN|nr:hypothetical protein [Aeromicrobium duanguangcaii]MCD9154724.1 hypothetical protein [Aeromicrobium duanguangcaii]UUI67862.1 hypothetical protein NP095_11720 [Aeromicrobium duanguangcaii]